MKRNLKLIAGEINTVGDIINALKLLPPDTKISPYGSANANIIYDEDKERAYIDEDFSWLELSEDEFDELFGQDPLVER